MAVNSPGNGVLAFCSMLSSFLLSSSLSFLQFSHYVLLPQVFASDSVLLFSVLLLRLPESGSGIHQQWLTSTGPLASSPSLQSCLTTFMFSVCFPHPLALSLSFRCIEYGTGLMGWIMLCCSAKRDLEVGGDEQVEVTLARVAAGCLLGALTASVVKWHM